jgi:hypothetical protein
VEADATGSAADAGADFEQLGAQGFDLGGAPGQGQLQAKEVDQVVGGGVQEEAESVGQEAVAAGGGSSSRAEGAFSQRLSVGWEPSASPSFWSAAICNMGSWRRRSASLASS